jgi:acetate kinase
VKALTPTLARFKARERERTGSPKFFLYNRAMLLVLNAGSSSLKFALYDLPIGERPQIEGQIAGIGRNPRFIVGGRNLPVSTTLAGHDAAIAHLLDWLEGEGDVKHLAGAGHRVVHGGARFTSPIRLDAAALDALEELGPLAPHHQPHNVAAIRVLTARKPALPQVACFDTAFHATQPEAARRLPLPAAFDARGVRRYGFHGLSYEAIVGRLLQIAGGLPRRLVVAHLGNGASMCAIEDGRSIATTMGFSTLDGLIMATRSGSLDPGVLLHLLREGMKLAELEDLLYNRAGLLALSGISAEMKVLLDSPDPAAAMAVDLYCYRISRELGSLAAALGGLDALVFTGGIGEHAAPIRARVCRAAGWLGITLDEAANKTGGPRLSGPESHTAAWVVPTDEQGVIARHTAGLLGL